jgi:hypothetical protein
MCDFALELGCPSLNLWPGQDGCDYLLCSDYAPDVRSGFLAVKQYLANNYHVVKTIYDWEVYQRK